MLVDTLNVAVLAFAATVIEVGAVNAGDALFVRVTTVALVTACDKVTVQVALPFELSVVAVQANIVINGAVCNEILLLAELPFSDPVKIAV